MKLSPSTTFTYLSHAFENMRHVLGRLTNDSVNEIPESWGTNSVAGLVVHCCELAPSWFEMPGLGRESHRDRESEFTTTATIKELNERISSALARLEPLTSEFDKGPTAVDHEFRAFLPGSDRSDAAVVLHVLEELYQHLGHMEVIADAVALQNAFE